MKHVTKIVLTLLGLLLILTACGEKELPETQPTTTQAPTQTTAAPTQETTQPTTVPETTEPTTVPTTEPIVVIPEIYPDRVGIFIPGENGRVRLTEFVAQRPAKKDIDCFEILASRDSQVAGGSFRRMWTDAWNAEPTDPAAKIGFYISFELTSGEVVSATILKPSDSKDFFEYLEIYLYDDIHQTPGVWYTHLEDRDMKEETVISSIKLTSGSKIHEVGDIFLTAFIYNGPDCFDAQGNYIGLISDTIEIRQP